MGWSIGLSRNLCPEPRRRVLWMPSQRIGRFSPVVWTVQVMWWCSSMLSRIGWTLWTAKVYRSKSLPSKDAKLHQWSMPRFFLLLQRWLWRQRMRSSRLFILISIILSLSSQKTQPIHFIFSIYSAFSFDFDSITCMFHFLTLLYIVLFSCCSSCWTNMPVTVTQKDQRDSLSQPKVKLVN